MVTSQRIHKNLSLIFKSCFTRWVWQRTIGQNSLLLNCNGILNYGEEHLLNIDLQVSFTEFGSILFGILKEVCALQLKYRKKDKFTRLVQGNILVVSYEAKLHASSNQVMKLLSTEEDEIYLYVKGLNISLQVVVLQISFNMTFQKMIDFVKKVEGVR